MRTPILCGLALAPVLALGLSGCNAPSFSDATAREPTLQSTCLDSSLRRDVDILFVIDNSASMSRKQRALVQAAPRLIQALDDLQIDYHIGVVTTDVGANPTRTSTFPGGRVIPGCASFSGDDGRLQNQPCTTRSGVSADALATCASLCPDPGLVPRNGARYIERKSSLYNVPSKKDAAGREIGPSEALKCMALVGDGGCGVESPLEAAKRALDGHLNENSGFLRSNSTLALVFLTDEDDCSVQISRRSELDPGTQDCTGNSSLDAPASCFGLDFRCLARSVECTDENGAPLPMTAAGARGSCREKPNNFLVPIQQYVNFFSTIRPAEKLLLLGIVPPSLLDAQAGSGKLTVEQDPAGPSGTPGLVTGRKERAACYNPAEQVPAEEAHKGFSGQAQLRLSSLLRRFSGQAEQSLCATDGYETAFLGLAERLAAASEPVFFLGSDPARFALGSDGKPRCQAELTGAATSGQAPSSLPRCGSTCCSAWTTAARPIASDPSILAACSAEPQDCYCVEEAADYGVIGGIWRPGGARLPLGTRACFSCLMDSAPPSRVF